MNISIYICSLAGQSSNIQPKGISRSGGFEEPILGRCIASMSAVDLGFEGALIS